MSVHKLKTNPIFFQKTRVGLKSFEIRLNDRDYKVGDTVILQEYQGLTREYTGLELSGKITYILKDFEGLKKGFIGFSLKFQ